MVRGSGGAGKQYTAAPASNWCSPAFAERAARYLIARGSGGAGKQYTATPASKWCSLVLMSVQFAGVFGDDNNKSLVSARLETMEPIASCCQKEIIIQGVLRTG